MENEYTVGYGKPPKSTQFKKGTSGNPKGRPKPPFDFTKSFISELRSKMSITENGNRVWISKIEALQKSAIAHALKGDKSLIKMIFEILRTLPKEAFTDESDGIYTFRFTQGTMDKFDQFLSLAEEYEVSAEDDPSPEQSNT